MSQTQEYDGNLLDAFGDMEADAQKTTRITELMQLIRYHRNLYYNDPDSTEITDEEFDAYVDELKDLDEQNEVLFEVGAPVPDDSNWEKGQHLIPMTSLDKVNTVDEMSKWMRSRYAKWVCVQEKLDGVSCSADYVDGTLKRVLTRGKGKDGEDITRNAVRFKGVLQKLPTRFTGSIRGEIMFFGPDYHAYNQKAAKTKGMKTLKNMRNGAGGLARRTNGKGVEYLRVLFYEIEGDLTFKSHFDRMNYMRKRLSLWTPWYGRVQWGGLNRVYKEYNDGKRENLPYEIDGLVIKVDSADESDTIEDTLRKSDRATANPKSQVAWKFANETRVTTVTNVSADFGLGGSYTPVVEVAPVGIGGVTVTRASIHNWDMLEDKKIKVGGKVLLERANDVIPQVVRMLDSNGTDVSRPTHCVHCSGQLTTEGKTVACRNVDCHGVIAGNIRKWIQNLEIDHFGMSIITPLVVGGSLKTVTDLYDLTEADIEDVSGKGTAKRAYRNLHAKMSVDLHILMGSLNITGFGRRIAEKLVKGGFDSIDKMTGASIADMAKLDGFGTSRATLIHNGLKAYEDVISALSETLIITKPRTAAADGPLKGKTFCITGALSSPKKVYETMIMDAGGGYETSLKSNVTHLIASDPDGDSGKLQKARKKGTQVIGEAALKALIAG